MIKSPRLIIALLTGFNLLNYIDRQMIAAVLPDLKQDLHFTDAQAGWVGSVFLVGYMLTSPLFGRLGDRMSRKVLITIGVIIWSAATACSGLMGTFLTMMAARSIVGVGEASYASLSPTIIDDITEPGKEGRVLAVFYAAIPVGSALGYAIGGWLSSHYGWRNAFFVVGGPGVLLALLCLFIAEPPRRGVAGGESQGSSNTLPLREAAKSLWASGRYVWAVAGFVAQTFALGGFSLWAPDLLISKFHVPKEHASLALGAILVVTGFAGTFVGGAWADRASGSDRTAAALRVCALSTAIAAPFGLLAVLTPGTMLPLFIVAMAVAQFGIFISMSPFNSVVLSTVRPETRATAMAMSIFAGHLLGDLISMPLVGFLSDTFKDLSLAMLILPVALAFNAVAWFVGVKRPAATGADATPAEPAAA